MYPNLYYAFKDIFDIDIPALKIVNTFGFFVAIAFLISAWVLALELKRKQAAGIFTYKETVITVGKTASLAELLTNFILGFILGYKILGVFIIKGALDNPQSFILSGQGHVPAGILVGLFFAGLKWWEKRKLFRALSGLNSMKFLCPLVYPLVSFPTNLRKKTERREL